MSLKYKRKRRRNDHGVDDWLMTYADMITLLLCFFAIFLSVSVPKDEQFEKARQQVMERFAAPDAQQGKVPTRNKVTEQSEDSSSHNSLPSFIDLYHTGEGRSVGHGVDAGEGQSEGMGEGTRQGIGQAEGMGAGQQQGASGESGRDGQEDGDRIKTLEMPSAAFFARGSAALSAEGAGLLQEIIDKDLKAADVQDYQITVEGHTDDVPINTLQFPSNWELSTARAASVVRFFIEHGVEARRLRASGYADVFPKAPNRDAAGNALPANQAQNRRVVIKLEKIVKAR